MFLSERAIVHFYHGYEEKCYVEGNRGFPKELYGFILSKKKPTTQKDTFGGVVSGVLQYRGRSFDNMDAKGMNLTNICWKEKADTGDR